MDLWFCVILLRGGGCVSGHFGFEVSRSFVLAQSRVSATFGFQTPKPYKPYNP